MNKKCNLKDLLSLNFLDLTNKTNLVSSLDLPEIWAKDIDIQYLALFTEKEKYNFYNQTCVCFFQFDKLIDGKDGLFNSIYYNNKKRLEYYKQRFKNVKSIILPDYSVAGDIPLYENIYRIAKSRIVGLWFIHELGIMAIPNITYTDESFFPIMIYGIEKTEIVGLSIIGTLNNPTLVKSAIKYVVDNLKCLKTIIVYTSSTDNVKIKKLFTYAKQNKIKIIIPKNTLLERNKTKVNGKI